MADFIFRTLSIFFAHYGYWAVFFGVMLENCGVPVPGETVVLFAGFLAYQGDMELGRAIVTAIAGATLGDSIGYWMGRWGGRAFVERHRRRLGFFARHFDRAQSIYLKHGPWAVFVARFITGLRVFSGILAGSFRMSYARFLAFDFTGAIIWAATIASVGFFFGSSWDSVVHFVKMFDRGILALGAIGIAVAGTIYFRKRQKSAENSGEQNKS